MSAVAFLWTSNLGVVPLKSISIKDQPVTLRRQFEVALEYDDHFDRLFFDKRGLLATPEGEVVDVWLRSRLIGAPEYTFRLVESSQGVETVDFELLITIESMKQQAKDELMAEFNKATNKSKDVADALIKATADRENWCV